MSRYSFLVQRTILQKLQCNVPLLDELEVTSGKPSRLTLFTGCLFCLLGFLGGSRDLLVCVLPLPSVLVSACGGRCHSDDPGTRDITFLPPPSCFSEAEVTFRLSSFFFYFCCPCHYLRWMSPFHPGCATPSGSSTTVWTMRVLVVFMDSAMPRGLLW